MVQSVRIHLQCRRPGFNPWVGKIPWRKKWLPTPVFLPGECHGQRSLEGYSAWDCKESDMTEQLTHTHIITYVHYYGIIQIIFSALNIHCASPVYPSLHPTPGIQGSVGCFHSSAFSRTLCRWNHTLSDVFRLASFISKMHLDFLCLFVTL